MKLIVAEKPSVAREIAKIVGASKKESGYISGQDYLVSWCIGHLVELATPDIYDEKLKKWELETLPIIPDEYKYVINSNTQDQYKNLTQLMSRDDVSEIICATDAGREGELIFRLVYNQSNCRKPFKRLWISSMEEKSIRDGLVGMKDGREYDNLYRAADCRQKADWLVGINLTRLYTKIYNQKLSTGRVQTPTLNLIVQRQNTIDAFVPTTYFNIIADLGDFKAQCRAEDKATATEIVNRCKGKEAIIKEVVRSEANKNPDALYDLTTLQRDANRLLGYTAQQTLDYMQSLYDNKLATYPRTDSRYITADMEKSTRALIDELINKGLYEKHIQAVYNMASVNIGKVVNDKKVSDHHAILPTSSVTKDRYEQLPTGEKNILTLILYRFLIAPYEAHTYAATKARIDIEGHDFEASGKEILSLGYKEIEKAIRPALSLKISEDKDESQLPGLSKGERYSVIDISAEAKKTQPPKAYTEDTLLSAMETAGKEIEDEELKAAMRDSGLGTTATRADIIEKLIRQSYIIREKKKLLPTDTGKTFIGFVNDRIKSPELTAEWEKKLAGIQQGELAADSFMNEITVFLRSFIEETKGSHTPGQSSGIFKTAIGLCPRCGKKILEYSKSYSCESGRQGCGFVIWKTQMGKTISLAQAKKLLENKKTDIIKGFESKAGNKFDARIILKADGTTGLEFANKKK